MTSYVNREIHATTCDDAPESATVEVTASIGEFAGILLELQLPGSYASVELTADSAELLMTALQDAITCLESGPV